MVPSHHTVEEACDVLLGDPAASALWLAQTLRNAGIELRPGDVLSLGSFNAPVPPEAGTTISVKFIGLPYDPAATVNFD